MLPFYFPFCDLYAHGFYRFIVLAFFLLREFRSVPIFKLINWVSHHTCNHMPLYDHTDARSMRTSALRRSSLSYTYL